MLDQLLYILLYEALEAFSKACIVEHTLHLTFDAKLDGEVFEARI